MGPADVKQIDELNNLEQHTTRISRRELGAAQIDTSLRRL